MKNKGFTLLETLVAVSILALALAGILSLSAIGIHSSSNASNQIKAFFLASESIEYVRNKRDSNVIAGSGWLAGLGGCEAGCFIDVYNDTISACPGGVCPKIKFDSANNRYNHVSGSDSVFTRKLTIAQSASYEVKINSEVSWMQGGLPRTFILEERMFDLSF